MSEVVKVLNTIDPATPMELYYAAMMRNGADAVERGVLNIVQVAQSDDMDLGEMTLTMTFTHAGNK